MILGEACPHQSSLWAGAAPQRAGEILTRPDLDVMGSSLPGVGDSLAALGQPHTVCARVFPLHDQAGGWL